MKEIASHSTAIAIVFATLVYAWINHRTITIDSIAINVVDHWAGTFSRCSPTVCREMFPPKPD